MNKRNLCFVVLLLSFFCVNYIYAEEIKYDFSNGAIYSYEYIRQDVSSVNAPIIATKKNSSVEKIPFFIKTVGFQDNAFILDIGNEKATVRRYISPNGSIKGSPAEDSSIFPFFLVFPDGDWKIGTSITKKNDVVAFGKKYPVNWTYTLNKIDDARGLAEIDFKAKFDLNDDKYYSKAMTLTGQIIFNMAEGVIHQADWKSSYGSKLVCKEVSITRELWTFQKQTIHSLKMTGVEK